MVAVDLPPLWSDSGELIMAPARVVYFDSERKEDETEALLNSYARFYRKEGKAKANEVLKQHVDSMMRTIAQSGMFILGRLGHFYSKKNRVEFAMASSTEKFNPFAVLTPMERGESATTEVKMPRRRAFKLQAMAALGCIVSVLANMIA